MKKKVVFLNTFHYSMDDRVYYHQAKTLNNNGYQIYIISTKEELNSNLDGIIISSYNDKLFTQRQKFENLINNLIKFTPDIIICDSPIAVLASSVYRIKHKVNVIYDITEWYPSKKNLANTNGLKKRSKAIALTILNFLAGLFTNGFIFGEHYKALPFKSVFFWKNYLLLPYYPCLDYIETHPRRKFTNEFNILYSGPINTDKGIDSVIKAIRSVANRLAITTIKLKIIGDFHTDTDRANFNRLCLQLNKNITIELIGYMAFPEFCRTIGQSDIFLDLRKIDVENTHCLPIKLFYYIACGRPVIYSNLIAIKKVIPEFDFGYLCDPMNTESIAECITECITLPEVYDNMCTQALHKSKTYYNWANLENSFISFVKNL